MKDLIETNQPLPSTSVEMRSVEATEELEASEMLRAPEASRISRIGKFLNPFNWMSRRKAIKLMQGALLGVMIGSIYITYIEPLVTCSSDDSFGFAIIGQELLNNSTMSIVEIKRRIVERFGGEAFERMAVCGNMNVVQRFDDAVVGVEVFNEGFKYFERSGKFSIEDSENETICKQGFDWGASVTQLVDALKPDHLPKVPFKLMNGSERFSTVCSYEAVKELKWNLEPSEQKLYYAMKLSEQPSLYEGFATFESALSYLKKLIGLGLIDLKTRNKTIEDFHTLDDITDPKNSLVGENNLVMLNTEKFHESLQEFPVLLLNSYKSLHFWFKNCQTALTHNKEVFMNELRPLLPLLKGQEAACIPEELLEE